MNWYHISTVFVVIIDLSDGHYMIRSFSDYADIIFEVRYCRTKVTYRVRVRHRIKYATSKGKCLNIY